MREHLALLRAHAIHQLGDALRTEETHEIIFERQEELARAWISLTSRASAQLPVDAPRFVALRSDDVQTAHLIHVDILSVRILHDTRLRGRDAFAKFDVGSAAGHVRRDGDRARLSGIRDDLGFTLVVLRVQHVVYEAGALHQLRQRL
jgi:hypothetical protein